ncbi:MAG TPA: hypothetical protein VD978_29300 [Azospirillum sp.]|nr:hypothetical protein [Azospirillum sp.]
MIGKSIVGMLSILALGGCAELNSIHRTSGHDPANTILVDAKQRAINVTHVGGRTVICAEKSPDVFSVLSASGAVGAQILDKAINASFAGSESGANIGLRTQLSQAQSELLYRLCEYYSAGIMSAAEVETEVRRFQNTIVGMLAIEQLTGYARPTIVAIGGSANADTGDKLAEAQKELEEARNSEASATTGLKSASEKASKAKQAWEAKQKEVSDAADDKKKALQDEADKLKAAYDSAQADVAKARKSADDATANRVAKEEYRNATRAVSAGAGSSAAQFYAAPQSVESAQAVASAVENILDMIVHQTFTTDLCLKYMFVDDGNAKASLPAISYDDKRRFCERHLERVLSAQIEGQREAYAIERIYANKASTGTGSGARRARSSNSGLSVHPYSSNLRLPNIK